MTSRALISSLLASSTLLLVPGCTRGQAVQAKAARVTVLPTPEGGIQPRIALDGRGTLHLIYYKGDASAGDIWYVRRKAGESDFSAPIRVNSVLGSAVALGTIRGAQIALGRSGRVHVAWNGSEKARPRNPLTGVPPHALVPMLYARMNDAGTAFERERNLMHRTFNLDGGGTLAASPDGRVSVIWHGNDRKGQDETDRRLWMATSTDDGKTFTRESAATPTKLGACACCGVGALADSKGRTSILYRSATEKVHRGIYLVTSPAGGAVTVAKLDEWYTDT
jgi:hypothetical protein